MLRFYFPSKKLCELMFSRQITVPDGGTAESLTKCGLFYLLPLKHIKIPLVWGFFKIKQRGFFFFALDLWKVISSLRWNVWRANASFTLQKRKHKCPTSHYKSKNVHSCLSSVAMFKYPGQSVISDASVRMWTFPPDFQRLRLYWNKIRLKVSRHKP